MSLLGLLIGMSSGYAQVVPEDVQTPEVWVQCSPISGLIELEAQLPEAYRESTKGLGEIGVSGFESLGGDPSGKLVAFGSDGVTMKIPYMGAAETVEAMLQALQPEAEVWQTNKMAWAMELVDDHWRVTLENGYLDLRSVIGEQDVSKPTVLDSLSGVDEAEGCWLMVDSEMTIPKTQIPLDGGLFIPFDKDPFSLLFEPKESLPKFLAGTGGQPLSIRTNQSPAVLVSLGFDWSEMFADPVIQQRLGLSPKEAKKLSNRLRIQPGGLIAFETINIRKDPKVSVALELHNRFGRAQCAWLIWRGIQRSLKQAGLDFVKLDDRILSFANNGDVFYVGVVKGRLYIGNTKAIVEEMMLNQGTEWANNDFSEFAQLQPVAVQVGIPDMIGMMAGGLTGVELGLRSVEGHAQVTAHLQMSHDNGWTGVLPFIAGQLPDPAPEVPTIEPQRVIQHLAAKQHQVYLTDGAYKPIGQTGVLLDTNLSVPASILDTAPVEPSASMIEWMEQPSSAMYWVEVSEDGFLVHGVFVWEGTLVHYTKDHKGQISVEPLTAE